MSTLPSSTEIGSAVAVILGGIAGVFGLWRKGSGARLESRENASKGDWLARIETERDEALARETRAIEREQQALERHRAALDTIAGMKYTISMLTEKCERQEKKMDLLMRLVAKARPDLAEVLTSAFGEFGNPEPMQPTTPKEPTP